MGPRFEVSIYGIGSNHQDYLWEEIWSGQDLAEAIFVMAEQKKKDSGKPVRLVWRGE